ncbi:UDP-N-acetylmuramate--L-alanine ligase [Borreliella americana]|uniref:UDP-N-acetylmuramate--L-alanine ligase n=1 Tax=Borreliella americana TaxID=478807 RepID=UPI001E4118BD|nr:UDP-N-acetylmuramate--L-alanine ligase [Borreliella americana]MCD2332324.1 UDP-N-acetylmuramate--L-alanine ligase [Borreliella americana]MCD2349656.1 UDP-N-acetylmuramate--L-alanine ligase [Borreliella americana]MCD2382696.1 UDP-N-acetylmuramate--L-alanine ligase [Borreliella americana]
MKIDFDDLNNIFFVGIKGSGTCSLACFLNSKGYCVEGVDVPDKFHTDEILSNNKISYYENIYEFSLKELDRLFDLIVYSSAYDKDSLQVLLEAKELNIPILSYPEVLGELSRKYYSIGIAGSHGKTTTTTFLGILFDKLGLNPNVIVGSSVKDFEGNSAIAGISNIFIVETCEYKKHFLNFNPNVLILTNVDYEHVDFFKNYEALEDAFLQYINNLKKNGILIINSDDNNLLKIKSQINRKDISIFSYGSGDLSDFQISNISVKSEYFCFSFLGLLNVELKTVLFHNVLNFSAALLALNLFLESSGKSIFDFEETVKRIAKNYSGIKRRVEVVKEENGVIYMDDYAHHPREIKNTLFGIKNFYKNKRIILDFMPHTFTRTKEFFADFVEVLSAADILILHNIYLSNRENFNPDELSVRLFLNIKKINKNTYFFKDVKDSINFIKNLLISGDLFITMGAGNNFILHDFL